MDFIDLCRILVRRWYVFLPVLFLAASMSVVFLQSVPSQYQASSEVITLAPGRLPPSLDASGQPINPYLNFSASLSAVADLTSKTMSDPTTVRSLKQHGVTGSYTVEPNDGASPSVTITDKGSSPTAVLTSVSLLVKEFRNEVTERQVGSGVSSDQLIRVVPLTTPVNANRLSGGKIKVGIALGAVGLVASVACAALAEAVVKRRRLGGESNDPSLSKSEGDSVVAHRYAELRKIGES